MGKGKNSQWRIGVPGSDTGYAHYIVGDAAVPDRVDPDLAIRYLIGTSPNLPPTSEFPIYYRTYSRDYVESIIDGRAPLLGEGDRRKGAKDWNFAKRTDKEQAAVLRRA